MPFFCRPAARPTPCKSLRTTPPPLPRQVRKGRTDARFSERRENIRSLRRCAANPGRAVPRPERRQLISGGEAVGRPPRSVCRRCFSAGVVDPAADPGRNGDPRFQERLPQGAA